MVIYLWLRFSKPAYGIAAGVALTHDVLITIGALAISKYVVDAVPSLALALQIDAFQINLTIVAALLTITGYSVNDTIVIFDRVRENLKNKRKDSLETVVNLSVNQTLGRTVITAGTTFLAVLALYLFGGEVLEGFAFTMLVGIVSGTYSTIFIAAAIAIVLSGKQAKARTPGSRKAS